ncbi:BTB/POZ domain and ankyrin repeat-containing protein NPR1-like [Coffea arabica]|uniref:BTB/POZ domain and ankyrin repeat-containing protein NPR1-like n=1 Tax=Coffea arabica TaxID=13443 RepID=A0A6P6SFD9_COFAR|nr:BTB/POZ domain and ankyrin repeat-containing protein NPR2-like [Coffea arabica]XP_027064516.1 BTB/POZ domain and ankyrin repeat-containing protein NPR2-like [Coffea arabica]XP_027064768.1 BTB/POZ domain and ankyrin repeat-containing protein NPR2-like [Coffea arabica]XP_027064769.1 BTB/POZ domain and ankyrin repeat-containing protein NPR2-like [Coffea arabica]
MESGNELVSTLSFASSSYTSNGSSSHNMPSAGHEPGACLDMLSLTKLSGSLEKLLLDAEFDYSDAEIVVEGTSVGVNRCILASRSPFFHDLFKKSNAGSANGTKPNYVMTELVPQGKIGYETFMVFLNYVYSGKLKSSPTEVSTCVDESCAHDACGPAINYAVELMYASATFQMNELVLVVQRRLLNFVDKAFVEDVIPITIVAFHCKLNQLLSHSIQRIARSDLDDLTLEKELPHEVLTDIKSFRKQYDQDLQHDNGEVNFITDKRIRRIHKALDSDDVELLRLLLAESDITLDAAFGLHYAAAYCNPKVVTEVLSLGNANLNLRNSRGYTVLHVAARRKDPSVIVGLLSKGACVSDSTDDGRTSITICRRLTRPKDYNESTKQGQETNKDKLCIDVLEREMLRNPLAGNMSMSSMMVADDLVMRLLLLENRVALARVLFPREAKLAMEIANAHSTSEFAGLAASKASCGNLREVDLNEIPYEQVKRLQLRLQALQKTVETGRRFFPNCSEVLDRFLEDDMQETLLLENGPLEEHSTKKMRYMELKDEVLKAFDKDKAENNWVGLSSSSSCSSSPKAIAHHKAKKRQLF